MPGACVNIALPCAPFPVPCEYAATTSAFVVSVVIEPALGVALLPVPVAPLTSITPKPSENLTP
jgi:hypothetical protein